LLAISDVCGSWSAADANDKPNANHCGIGSFCL